jgi:hypothetical protein
MPPKDSKPQQVPDDQSKGTGGPTGRPYTGLIDLNGVSSSPSFHKARNPHRNNADVQKATLETRFGPQKTPSNRLEEGWA